MHPLACLASTWGVTLLLCDMHVHTCISNWLLIILLCVCLQFRLESMVRGESKLVEWLYWRSEQSRQKDSFLLCSVHDCNNIIHHTTSVQLLFIMFIPYWGVLSTVLKKSMLIKHWKIELRKQIFPRFTKPAGLLGAEDIDKQMKHGTRPWIVDDNVHRCHWQEIVSSLKSLLFSERARKGDQCLFFVLVGPVGCGKSWLMKTRCNAVPEVRDYHYNNFFGL